MKHVCLLSRHDIRMTDEEEDDEKNTLLGDLVRNTCIIIIILQFQGSCSFKSKNAQTSPDSFSFLIPLFLYFVL